MTFLSLAKLKPEAARSFLTLASGSGKAAFEHRAVWTLFDDDPGAKRDFLFRVTGTKPLTTYVLSRREPRNTLEHWEIETKPFAPVIEKGMRIRFDLTAVPAVKVGGAAYDAIRFEWHKLPEQRRRHIAIGELIVPVGVDWLRRKGESAGFTVEEDSDVVISNWLEHVFFTGRRTRVTLHSLGYTGLLTVAEPDLFRAALTGGIGRGRGFGFGLLLGRPA